MFSVVSCKKTTTNTTVVADSVLYSKWIPLNLQLVNATDSDYSQQITATAITSTILNTGAINVYANVSGSNAAAITLVQDYGLYPTFSPGTIYLDAFGYSGYQLSSNQYIDSVRYVVIPAKVATTSADGTVHTYTAQQLKELDYNSLTKTLGIPSKGSNFTNN